ncbi:MAG: acetylxylan esterase [Acidobacteria bacterium]|nr:acetylxylan esterase [Acidobacteriota bacterium]
MRRREFPLTLLAPLAARGAVSYGAEYEDMLVRHLTGEVNRWTAHWDAERAKITTAAQMEARNRDVRAKMRTMIHGLPERNPLGAVTVKSFERKGYRVENVMFQSRPDFWVTGNLYIPTRGNGPFPGIISPCGHYADSRMNPEYQSAYINLVLGGFVVLAYDPIGQGERRQYWNPDTGETEVGGATTEHSMVGHLLFLLGEDLTHYRVWDGMRAVDYLMTRPEVDRDRIGCAGHSGGGTLTRFIAAMDERVKVAVINQGGTANRWPVQYGPNARIGPSDVEQNLFPGAKLGVDHVDMQAAIAPRPLLVLIEDYYPRFNEAVERIRSRYALLGAVDRFAADEATDPHAWTPKLRIATTRWFSKWFYGRPGPDAEPDFEVESAQTLYCTPKGSVRYSGKGKTIYSLVKEKAAGLPPAGLTREKLRELLRLPAHTGDLGVRPLVTTERKGYKIEKLEFLSEPGIYVPVWVFVPARVDAAKPAVLWVDERGKQAEGLEFGRLEKMAREGQVVVSIDVRGVGETRPAHPPSSDRGSDYGHLFDVDTALTYLGWYVDKSLLGMRVFDVMRAVEYAASRSDVKQLEAVGRGAGALWTLMAAVFEPRIRALRAERMLASYKLLAESDRYSHGASSLIKDVLLHGDLPQIAKLAAGCQITMVEPVDAMKRRV